MADVNANIGVGIDTSDALAQLKNLQRQISNFHTSIAKSSETAAASQRNLQKNFLNSINAIEGFSAELRTVKTTSEAFSTSLEKNKFSMREYFRYAAGATKTFGKSFKSEFDTIEKTAVERVKTLQTQFIKVGRDANGAMQAIKIRPTTLDMTDLGTQIAIAGQKQVLFNQLLKQGSTNLLNFGKNTQWAGRQLMVGFTLPLATLGLTAGRTFMEMEKAVLKFRKVYGDLFTTQAEVEDALQGIKDLAAGYTQYGVAIKDTIGLAAEAAAAGYQGVDLQNQTAAATKLSILGQIEQQQALETTIALQNAFKSSSGDLAAQIDFLNAVENQTVVSLDDITTAIPKVAPVIQQLGGDVKDLAFFMAAFEEGGINASEGANALKSGLAALINPTAKASEMLATYGINIRGIVDANQGNLAGTVVAFSAALDKLAPTDRARAIEQLFGKFQFARLSTLFQNVAADGTQAARVLGLAGSSVQDLAALTDKELGQTAASTMNKFTGAVENLNASLAPVGEQFMKIATPFIEFATKVLEGFNKLPDGVKSAITTTIGVVGGLAPIFIMVFGLLANGLANAIKFFAIMRQGFLKITGQASGAAEATQYMTNEQLEASAAAASLNQAHSNLTQQFTAETSAVMQLKSAYEQAVAAGNRFALMNPGQMRGGGKLPGFANGGIISGPGTGKSDSIGAMVSKGEAIIPADMAKKYAPLVQGIIAGNIPGFVEGEASVGLPSATKLAKQFGEKGSDPVNASHLEMFSPRNMAATLKSLSSVDEAFGNIEVQLTKFVPRLDELGNHVEIDGKKIYDSVVTLQKVKDLDLQDLDAFVSGQAFGGTAVNESRSRNIGAYQAAGIDGASFTLKEVQTAGEKAAKALAENASISDQVRVELERLVLEGRRATELLSSENAATADFTYSKEIATKGLTESLLKDTSNGHTASTALAEAQRRVAETEQKFAANIASGMDEQEALRLAQAELAGKLFASSKREDQSTIPMVAGDQGAGRSLLRPTAALGPTAVKSNSPRQIGNLEETPGVQRGRGAATIEAMLIKEAQKLDAVGFDFATAVSDTFYGGINRGLGINSPSKEFNDIADGVAEGVRQTKPEAQKAGKEIGSAVASGSSFGPGSKEPKAAVGNSPREVVAAMESETRSSSTFAQDIKASFANARSNISTEMGWVKQEFLNVVQSIKAAFTRGGQETVANVDLANKQLVINGKEAGFNYIAQMQGRDGAVEAVLTKKTAEMVSGITEKWNSGVRDIPLMISDGLKDQKPLLDTSGIFIAEQIAKSSIKRAKELQVASAGASVSGGTMFSTPIGPEEDPDARKQRMSDKSSAQLEKVDAFSSKLSGVTLGLSALTGVMSMFGGQFGEFSSILMGVTGAMFALMQITQMLTKAQGTKLIMDQVNSAGGIGQLFNSFKGVATGMSGLGKGLGGLWGVVKTAFPIASRLVPVLGGVLLAFQAFQFITGVIKDQQEKMRGFASATNMASDKLVELSKAAGNNAVIKPVDITASSADITTSGAVNVQTQSKADAVIEAAGGKDKFKETYGTQIEALKTTKEDPAQSKTALANIALQLSLAGNNAEQVEGIVTALQQEAGLTDVSLDFKSLNVYNPDGSINLDAVTNAANATATSFQNSYDTAMKKWRDAGGDKPLEIPTGGVAFGPLGQNVDSTAKMEQLIAGQQQAINTAKAAVGPEAAKTDSQIRLMESDLAGMQSTLAAYNGTFQGTAETNTAVTETIATTVGTLGSLTGAFKAGKMTVTDFSSGIDTVLTPLLTVGDATSNLNQLISQIPDIPPTLADSFTTTDEKVALLKANLAGVNLKPFADEIKSGKSKASVLAKITAATTAATSAQSGLNAQVSYEAATKPLDDQIAAIEGQITAYQDIAKQTGDTALAYQITGDAALMAAYNTALAADEAAKAAGKTTNYVGEFLANAKKLQGLQKKYAGFNPSGGSKKEKEDPYKDGLKSLREQRAELNNSKTAFDALMKTEKDAGKAMEYATNPQLLALMADGVKVGSKKWKDMLLNIKAVETATLKLEKIKAFAEGMKSLKDQKDQVTTTASAYDALIKAGYDTNQALKLSESPELLALMSAGVKAGSKEWLAMIDAIKGVEAAQEALRQNSPQGMTDQFNEVYDKVSAIFAAGEAELDAAYEKKTSADKKLIGQLEDQIDAKNDLMEGYNKQLEGIAEKEEAINKAYDEKAKKLEEVKKVNQAILNQQKSQQSIAEALSKGDISAAATAIQESRANNAQAALDSQSGAMDAAKAAQLGAVTSANGLTRVELEGKIKTIQNEIYNIQNGTLKAAQDRVKAADDQLVLDKAALTVQGLTKTAWADKKIEIDKAESSAKLYEKDTLLALGNVANIVAEWKKVPATVKTNVIVTYTTVGNPPAGVSGTTNTTATANPNTKVGTGKLLIASTGGMVPSYFANGGFAKGTDTVPSMLTPGEFIVNSASSKRFAPLLEAMNTGTFRYSVPPSTVVPTDFNKSVYNVPDRNYSPADPTVVFPRTGSEVIEQSDNSVYNYNLSISIDGNGLNADEIANRVMSKIKRVDSQRLRNQGIR